MTSMTASRPAPPPIPSHSSFLLAQIRSSIAHLHATSDIDEDTFQQLNNLLSHGGSKNPTQSEQSQSQSHTQSEEQKMLGTNNAWLRKTLIETSFLSDALSLAMNIAVPGALLGSTQQQSIIELVELSKVKIANAITDPSLQKKTSKGAWTGAKGAHTGIRKGFNAAGQSVGGITRKREESRMKVEMKKTEKEEKKAIKDELKREREEILIKRQMNMLDGNGEGSQSREEMTTSTKPTMNNPEETAPATTMNRNLSLAFSEAEPIASDVDGEAMVSVACSQLSSQGSVAATTTFSPWPGLLLTSTLIASNDEETANNSVYSETEDYQSAENNQDLADQSRPLPPPPRRDPPQPSQSSGTPMQNTGSSQFVGQQASSRQTGSPLQTSTSEVEDVTDTKQKSWSKKFGL